MKFLSSKYLTIFLGAILTCFFAYDILQYPLVIVYWLIALLFLFFFCYVPGIVLTGKKITDRGLKIQVGLAIGIVFGVMLFMLAQYVGNIWILIVPIIGLDIYWVFKHEKKLILPRVDLATVNSVLFIMAIVSPFIIFNLPVSDLSAIKAVDGINNVFWQISRIEMFKQGFPAGDWAIYAIKDIPFKYHYLFHLWLAEMSKVTGIGVCFLYFRFFAYFVTVAIFLSALKFAQLLTGNRSKAFAGAYLGTLGAGATCALSPISMLKYGGIKYIFAVGYATYFAWFLLSPTMPLSIFFFFILISLLHLWHVSENEFPYAVYFLIFLALLASKGSSGMIYTGVLAIYSLIYFNKKFLTRVAIPTVILFAVGYAFLFMGFAEEGTATSEKLGFYFFKEITWMSDSITGVKMWVMLGGFLAGTIGLRIFSVLSRNKSAIAKFIKIGFVLGTLLFIVSPIKFTNVFWQVPFVASAGVLAAEFIMDIKKSWLKKALMAVIVAEILFGSIHVLNGGYNGYIENSFAGPSEYFNQNEYEAYAYIRDTTPENSVVWSMYRGEDKMYLFDCIAVCARQNVLEGWGWSRYIGNWKYFTDEQKEGHFIQVILDDENILKTSQDPSEISDVLARYDYVDYFIYPLKEAVNSEVFGTIDTLNEVYRNDDFVIYEKNCSDNGC